MNDKEKAFVEQLLQEVADTEFPYEIGAPYREATIVGLHKPVMAKEFEGINHCIMFALDVRFHDAATHRTQPGHYAVYHWKPGDPILPEKKVS